MQNAKDEKNKQAYEKPKLRIIELTAEEVLGVGCKTRFSDPIGVGNYGCTNGFCSSTAAS